MAIGLIVVIATTYLVDLGAASLQTNMFIYISQTKCSKYRQVGDALTWQPDECKKLDAFTAPYATDFYYKPAALSCSNLTNTTVPHLLQYADSECSQLTGRVLNHTDCSTWLVGTGDDAALEKYLMTCGDTSAAVLRSSGSGLLRTILLFLAAMAACLLW
eukprot:CAMPEP_0115249554 /NCGR_PEP_ID=MMETSP0270-20121206/42649_1 /TAXON_ID=71861 /ORGANISM="Scrippsiella trochoidea, Strain CCMP3099" /LENGTH=159 /DNA_ID=CAMNT_0002664897 /DNA_START=6 /DNA_END=485 /DNA_ORIENTATION=+